MKETKNVKALKKQLAAAIPMCWLIRWALTILKLWRMEKSGFMTIMYPHRNCQRFWH